MAQSAISTITVVPVPRTPTASGRTLVAIGTRGPLFSRPDSDCPNCKGFTSVKVRDGRGGLQSVNCDCTTRPALALSGR